MKRFKFKAFFKNIILFLRPGFFLSFLGNPLLFLSNLIKLSKWISKQPKTGLLNDFYNPFRDYGLRYKLYEYVVQHENLINEPIDYLEFGVFRGESFKWWLKSNQNSQSKFFGFDTFDGLPESWGTYKKGDMHNGIPVIEDPRHTFYKGLFQDTLPEFLDNQNIRTETRKVIHLDADLFSSTLFVLTTLHKYLKNGDILLFDEFNVPNHEFFALQCYTNSYYVKYELIGAVNNYFQVALRIKK